MRRPNGRNTTYQHVSETYRSLWGGIVKQSLVGGGEGEGVRGQGMVSGRATMAGYLPVRNKPSSAEATEAGTKAKKQCESVQREENS